MSVEGVQGQGLTRRTAQAVIADAAQRTGVSFGYLIAQAEVESGMRPAAKASTSTAAGLFQFTRQTWLATLSKHGAGIGLGWAASAIEQRADGRFFVADPQMRQQILDLRFDAQASAEMAAEFAGDNAVVLRNRLGREPEPVDLYLAHFLGAGGASTFLGAWRTDPTAAAAPLFPKAAAANKPIFFNRDGTSRTLGEIRDAFVRKLAMFGAGEKTTRAVVNPTEPANTIRAVAVQSPHSVASVPLWATSSQSAFAMRDFEAMPGKLSLAFAERAYRRLSALSDAGLSAQ
jgi:Transglycosylase SLT domain